jgi:hypothetical protein
MIMEYLFLNQWIHEIWLRSLVKGKSHAQTLMRTSIKISSDLISKYVDSTLYKSMIGSLLYIIATKPNIVFRVGMCARLKSNP